MISIRQKKGEEDLDVQERGEDQQTAEKSYIYTG